MIKIVGFSLLGLLAIMIMPASLTETTENPYIFGGMTTLVAYDANGDERFAQQIYNRIVDSGEDLLVDAIFSDGVAVLDTTAVGKICAFQYGSDTFTSADGNTTTVFDNDNENSGVCTAALDEVTTAAGGTAVINNGSGSANGMNFLADGINLDNGETVRGIAVCAIGQTPTNATCAGGTQGVLFALIDTGNVAVATGDSILITYTFDISDSLN